MDNVLDYQLSKQPMHGTFYLNLFKKDNEVANTCVSQNVLSVSC